MKRNKKIGWKLASLMLGTAATITIIPEAVAQDVEEQIDGDEPSQGGPSQDDSAPVGGVAALLDVPLEDLLTLEATSVAKKRQQVKDSSAAVYVITQEDIRRSAASTIPDLLRAVPGVEVGQTVTGSTAVSIRGFNSRFTNSLLVMIDGRSIYVSTISGVFWDQLLLPLGDIERIEVVRGPGAALWGANAVNGVINIITKHSADSLGLTANARASSRKQEASLSYGGRISDTMSFRVYGDIRRDKGSVDALGNDQSSHWQGQSVGARVDWEPNGTDAITLQTEYADGKSDSPFLQVRANLLDPGYDQISIDNKFTAYNVLARWTRRQSDTLDWSLQAHYDRLDRTDYGSARLNWQLADLDFGLHWKASEIHDFNFGAGVRVLHDKLNSSPIFYFDNPSSTDRWFSGYVQDDISLIPDELRLTLGAKAEHNNFTGFEFQPSAKLFFRPDPGIALWTSISRAVRTPSRFERAAHVSFSVDLPGSPANPTPLPIYSTINGVPDVGVEKLLAYEAGFRADISRHWSLDVAGYYNDHSNLTNFVLASAAPIFAPPIPFPVGLAAQVDFAEGAKANTWGVEASLKGEVTPWWKTELKYSHFDYSISNNPATGQPYELLFALDASPRHQLGLHNSFDIGDRLALDTDVRHVSSLLGGLVPAYTDASFRASYRPLDGLELSLIGENLLKKRRLEFSTPAQPTPLGFVPRTISAEIRYRF